MSTGHRFIVGWIAALTAFIVAGAFASTHDTFPADVWLAHRIQEIDSAAIGRALNWAEDSADLAVVVLICGVTTCALLLVRDAFGAAILLIAVPGRVVTTWILKELIERPRPSADLLEFTSQPDTFSFPSGHAAGAFVVYGLIFYFTTLHIRGNFARGVIQVACVAIIIGAGLERIYVGHHWPSDVLGGYFHGALIVSAAIAVNQIGRRGRHEVTSARPHRFHVRRQHEANIVGRVRKP